MGHFKTLTINDIKPMGKIRVGISRNPALVNPITAKQRQTRLGLKQGAGWTGFINPLK